MRRRSRQRGISFWGLLMGAIILGFGTLIGLKLFPVYMESWKIDKAMKGVVEDPSVKQQSKGDVLKALVKRLDIDDVRAVGERNWKDTIKISKRQEKVIIQVQYRKETPLFGNLSLVANFDKIVEN